MVDESIRISEKYIIKKYINSLARKIQPKDSVRLLDLGCGEGRLHKHLMFTLQTGVDIDEDMIRKATESYGLGYQVMNMEKLDFQDDKFDIVFSAFCSIDYPSNQSRALSEVNRVLKPNGLFIYSSYNPLFWKHIIRTWLRDKGFKVGISLNEWRYHLSPELIERMLPNTFCLVEKVGGTFCHSPYYIMRNVKTVVQGENNLQSSEKMQPQKLPVLFDKKIISEEVN